ncbi:MAG: hypothetical protein GQ535_05220 [Rhodobacteraceae bacterium]|nr:hypothetical protein [Paracoccaceae bacterium]
MKFFNNSIGALLLISACTSPDISSETANLAKAMNAISTDISAVLDPELEAEANGRRNDAIEAGQAYFSRNISNCNPNKFSERLEDLVFPNCALSIIGGEERPQSQLEKIELIQSLLVEYANNLSLLANSNSASEIQASTANLIAKTQAFAQVAGNENTENGWVFSHSKAVSGLAGFISAQSRNRMIRSTLIDAKAPIEFAAEQLIEYLLDPSADRDPILEEWVKIKDARARFVAAPNSIQAARQFEAAIEAYQKVQAKSPAIKLVLFIRAHNALVARVSGPPTVEEAVTLVNEINALIALIEA